MAMTHRSDDTRQEITGMMRIWFGIDVVLVFISGLQLFVFSESTDRFFAWTVQPPISAAFMGASYWASVFLVGVSAFQKRWVDARIAVPAVWLFTAITLVATLLHIDRFHLNSPQFITAFVAWVWLFVYLAVTIVLPFNFFRQVRASGDDPTRADTLPRALRMVLFAHAVLTIVLGAILFLSPLTISWVWKLTPLTSRTIGAWFIGVGVIAGHMAWENEWRRVFAASLAYTALGVLHLVVVARYPAEFNWSGVGAWLYVGFWLSVLLVGVFMVLVGKRQR
jgi:hypothetical protein